METCQFRRGKCCSRVLLDNAVYLFKALLTLNTLCSRRGVSILDILMKKIKFTFSIEKICPEYTEISQEQLQSNLSYFGMEVEEMSIMEALFSRFCVLMGKLFP